MKRLIVSGSICALWLLASCSPGEGTMDSCASVYVGSFEGIDLEQQPISGSITGRLDAVNMKLELIIRPDGTDSDDSPSQALVAEDGTLMPGPFIQSGEFDFDDCTASGTYKFGFFGEGTWQLELPDTAL